MLKNCQKDKFVEILGGVYEKSPWVATGFYEIFRPEWDNLTDCQHQMRQLVDNASNDRQLALLRAHPELVGKLALAGQLTAESTREQAGAGLNQCSPAEFSEFQVLNGKYNQQFGFPFIVAVSGLTRQQILQQFRARIGNDTAVEFTTALNQVHKIAAIRLDQIFNPTNH